MKILTRITLALLTAAALAHPALAQRPGAPAPQVPATTADDPATADLDAGIARPRPTCWPTWIAC